MRAITNNAINAFMCGQPFSSGNTTVQVLPNVTKLLLHGNCIAFMYNNPKKLYITTCGWNTNITKSRLNAIPNVSIQTKNKQMFLNGVAWDGSLIGGLL